jgi:hypothetical protein
MTKQEYIDVAVRYFPDALAEIGELCVVSNNKHNPGEPIHWSREKSNDHAGSWGRHIAKMGTIDPESGLPHDTSVGWRRLAMSQIRIEEQ